MFYSDGRLDQEALSEDFRELLGVVLDIAIESRCPRIRSGHFLLSCASNPTVANSFAESLRGRSLEKLRQGLISLIYFDPARSVPTLNFLETDFTPPALEALRSLDALAKEGWSDLSLKPVERPRWSPLHLLLSTLRFLDDDEREIFEQALDLPDMIHYLSAVAREFEGNIKEDAMWAEKEMLVTDQFAPDCLDALLGASRRATQQGYDQIYPLHLLLILAQREGGMTADALRLFAAPGLGLSRILQEIERALDSKKERREEVLSLNRQGIATSTQEILRQAHRLASSYGHALIAEPHLLSALITHGDVRLKNVLHHRLNFDLEQLKRFGLQEIANLSQVISERRVINWPSHVCPAYDLTRMAENDELPVIIGREVELDEIMRVLFRRENRRVLLHGERGVGKTAILHALAQRMATDQIPFLKGNPFFVLDASQVRESEVNGKISQIFAAAESQRGGVYAIEEMDRLLGADPQAFRDALSKTTFPLIGTMSDNAFYDLVSLDSTLLQWITPIEVKEPNRDDAIEILRQMKPRMEVQYEARIEDETIVKSVKLSSDFILNERLPLKAINVLRKACDDARYDIYSHQGEAAEKSVKSDHVFKQIARITRLPETMIRGIGENKNYAELLGKMVIGQTKAVVRMGQRLDLIHKGLVDKKRPAAVCLFAGLPGTGKTELAKSLAKIYSESKSINLFPLGQMKEHYAVAELLGAQPGTVGYDSGGPLVNALNRDPYGVFLFDEVEKAHPEVLDALLNLFEEGWIRDRRNVVAKANKAILIMTTNAGVDAIDKGIRKGLSIEGIQQDVRKALMEVTNPNTGRLCFRPEFLGRIDDIIIFEALQKADLQAIAELQLKEMTEDWLESREITLSFDPEVSQKIGELAHSVNEREGGKKGGRAVREIISLRVKIVLSERLEELNEKKSMRFGIQDFNFIDNESHPRSSSPPLDSDTLRLHAVARKMLELKPDMSFDQRFQVNDHLESLAKLLGIEIGGD